MRTCEEMIVSLQNDEWNEQWERLYLMNGSPARCEWAKQRAIRVIEGFRKRFSPDSNVGVALFSGASENAIYYGPRMALAVLSAIPMVVLFLVLQKYIVQSIAVSGIKQ